jgi:hypothetical protein
LLSLFEGKSFSKAKDKDFSVIGNHSGLTPTSKIAKKTRAEATSHLAEGMVSENELQEMLLSFIN